jgi:hypothetical protein
VVEARVEKAEREGDGGEYAKQGGEDAQEQVAAE